MSDMVPYADTTGLSRPARQAGRAISRHRMSGQVRVAGVDADTDVSVAKLENLTMATGVAMQSVLRIASAQKALEQIAPEASGRLSYLADDHMLGMSDLLADLRRSLRRR